MFFNLLAYINISIPKLETGNADVNGFETEYQKINPVLGSQGSSNIWETTNIPKLVKTGNAGILTVCWVRKTFPVVGNQGFSNMWEITNIPKLPVVGNQESNNIWEITKTPKLVKTGNAGILTIWDQISEHLPSVGNQRLTTFGKNHFSNYITRICMNK